MKLSAVGQALPGDGEKIALENARAICVDGSGGRHDGDPRHGGPHHDRLHARDPRELRQDFPQTGAVLQAYLCRTEADCRDLARRGLAHPPLQGRLQGARVRGLAGHGRRRPVLRALPARSSWVAPATRWWPPTTRAWSRSPRPSRSGTTGRKGTYEYQMLYGVRPDEQRRLAAEGERMRVYVPYGDEWYGYLVRRMAEKPANLALFLARRLTSRR